MSVFDPQKLSVNLIPPAASSQPLEGRKYTLTHSDVTAQLFLDIGYVYNYAAINPTMRDEVLAEWTRVSHGHFSLIGSAHVDGGEFDRKAAELRFRVFHQEMDTALHGMVYGDRPFYVHYPSLLDAPIFIHYLSAYPEFRQVSYYGTPRQYLAPNYLHSPTGTMRNRITK